VNLAVTPSGRVNHLAAPGATRTACGRPLTGMAVWPVILNRRVNQRPTCTLCRQETTP
jgi:hypothetical protein